MNKPTKEPGPKPCPMRTKSFAAGLLALFVVQAVGWPIALRLAWKANLAQQLCAAQIVQKTDAIAKGPHATGNSISDAALGKTAALDTPQCQAASAAYGVADTAMHWVSPIALLAVLLSAIPWGRYFMIRWIAKLRKPVSGKPRTSRAPARKNDKNG